MSTTPHLRSPATVRSAAADGKQLGLTTNAFVHEPNSSGEPSCRSSINSLATSFDRFPSWNCEYDEVKTGSASAFCGDILHSVPSSHTTSQSLRTPHHRPGVPASTRFDRASLRLSSASPRMEPRHQALDGLQRALTSLANNYHSRAAQRPAHAFDIMSRRPSHAVTSKVNSPTLAYVPASDALVFQNLTGASQSTTASVRPFNTTLKETAV